MRLTFPKILILGATSSESHFKSCILILSNWATIKTYRMGERLLQNSKLGQIRIYSPVTLHKLNITVFQLQNLSNSIVPVEKQKFSDTILVGKEVMK